MKEARSSSRLALVIGLVVAIIVACGPDRDDDHTESTKEELRSNPQLSGFAVYASNSVSIMDRVQVQGGDVGVEHSSTSGPFLVTGYEAALSADSRIDTTRDLLAEDVFLRDRATVGDVEATHITNQFGVYAHQYALPTMPAFPSVATPAPGTSTYSVSSGQTQTLAAGAFAAVTVNGTLNLSGGTYDFASLTLGNDARLQAQGTTVLRIAGRVSTGDRAHIEATGTSLSAKDLRVEVSGQNGSTGALSASPKAFALGNDTVVRALVIVPNGTLQTGQRTNATGALFGRDVLVNLDARATFQDGVTSQGCGSCDDTNPCTTDTCNAGSCTHTPVANGTSCDDHNGCTTSDSCQNGACVGGSTVVCQPSNSCHNAGVCDPATGVCSNPPKADGTACGSNACSPNDHCQGGSCVAGPSTTCTAVDACHLAGTCNPSTGVCSNPPAPAGSACGDSNVCNGIARCDGSGACVPGVPAAVDDGNPCTIDLCDPVLGVIHTPAPGGTSCSNGNACDGAESCDGAGSCMGGTPPIVDDGNPCTDDSCDPATGVIHAPRPAGDEVCSDHDACNGVEACNGAGSCAPGTPPVLDDGNVCTTDTCSPITGPVHTPIAGCDPTPTRGEKPFETRASILGHIVRGSTPVSDASFIVRDLSTNGAPPVVRTDVLARTGSDGSFRIRLTTFSDSDNAATPPKHVLIEVNAAGALPAYRETWLHTGDAVDVGTVHLASRDPAITNIGPAGGTASDSQGRVSVIVPPGALTTTIPIQITPIATRDEMPARLPDSTPTLYGFVLEPDGTQFAAPVTVRMTNTKSVPTSFTIPVGVFDMNAGRWDHLAGATWDGSAFRFQTTHFSIFDGNLGAFGRLMVKVLFGIDTDPPKGACAASQECFAGGNLRESFPLPSYEVQGSQLGVTLHYDSGLGSSRTLGPAPSAAAAVPHSSFGVPSGSASVTTKCVASAVVLGLASGVTPGTCPSTNGGGGGGGARCALGTPQTTVVVPLSALRSVLASTTEDGRPVDDTTTEVERQSNVQLPLVETSVGQADGVAPPGLYRAHTTVRVATPQACVGSGGTFGVANTQSLGTLLPLEDGPLATYDEVIFVRHRLSSPYGAGWSIREQSRVYVPTHGDIAFLSNGDGTQERFQPRAYPHVVRYSTGIFSPARDPSTGEILVARSDGFVDRVDPSSGASVRVGTGLANNAPYGFAVAYVEGQRRFVVAYDNGLREIDASGSSRTLVARTPTFEALIQQPSVAARGDLVFYTDGLSPILRRVRLSDPNRTVETVSLATGGDLRLNPISPLSGVTFAQPHGVAFQNDGTLLLADTARHTVFAISPQANGEVGPDSTVRALIGDGSSSLLTGLGQRYAAEAMPIREPMALTTAEDGTVYVLTTYGVAQYDPVSREAEWQYLYSSQDELTLRQGDQPFAALGLTRSSIVSGQPTFIAGFFRMVRTDVDLLSSQFEPTRTIVRLPAGGFELRDTGAETIDRFDGIGRVTENRRLQGELVRSFRYSDADSERLDRIVDVAGGETVFAYDGNGKLASITDPQGRVTSVTVNGQGDVTQLTQPGLESHSFTYDSHRIAEKRNQRGDVTRYTFTGNGTIETATRPEGAFSTFDASLTHPGQQNTNGTLVHTGSYTDARGVVHTLDTNRAGGIDRETYTVDGVTRVVQSVYATSVGDRGEGDIGDPVFSRRLNTLFRVAHRTINGVRDDVSVDTLDAHYRPLRARSVSYNQDVATWFYTPDGLLQAVGNGSDTYHAVERDAAGHVIHTFDAAAGVGGGGAGPTFFTVSGRETLLTIRPDGQVAAATERAGTRSLTYTMQYDAAPAARFSGWSDSVGRTASLIRDNRGNITQASDGVTTSYATFDALDRVIETHDALGNATTYGYSDETCGCTRDNLVTSMHTPDLPAGVDWQLAYDGDGRLSSVTDPEGFTETYEYEANGELKHVKDRLGRDTTWTRDRLGRVTALVDIASRAHRRAYPVPLNGAWTGPALRAGSGDSTAAASALTGTLRSGDYQIGANGFPTEGYPAPVSLYRDATFQLGYLSSYDRLGRLTSRQDRTNIAIDAPPVNGESGGAFSKYFLGWNGASFSPVFSFESAPFPGGNAQSSITQNAFFEDIRASGFGGGFTGWSESTTTRDNAGRPTAMSTRFHANGNSDVRVDVADTYSYFPNGRVSHVVDPVGTHDFTYDTRGLLATHTILGEGTYTFGYDEVGRNSYLEYPDGHVRRQLFDDLGRITSRCYEYSASTVRCYTASYDAVGNPVTMSDPAGTDTIAYDNLDRVSRITRVANGATVEVDDYTYNALGALRLNAGVTLDAQRPRLDGGGVADAAVPATLHGQPVTLDPAGRMTSVAGTSLAWNARGHLDSMTPPAPGVRETYYVDPYHRQVLVQRGDPSTPSVDPNNVRFSYFNGANRIAALSPAGSSNVADLYVFAGIDHPLRIKRGGQTVYYELDLAGNVRNLRLSGGADLGSYRYTAFGTTADDTATSTFDQPLRWKARWHRDFGGVEVYDMRARQWVPELGAFLSIDEFAFHDARSTLWGWPRQSPIRFRDPTGRLPMDGSTLDRAIGARAPDEQAFQQGMTTGGALGALLDLHILAPGLAYILDAGLFISSERELPLLGLGGNPLKSAPREAAASFERIACEDNPALYEGSGGAAAKKGLGVFDGQIAEHAAARNHFPGKSVADIKDIIADVRANGTAIQLPNGNVLTQKDGIVLERIREPDDCISDRNRSMFRKAISIRAESWSYACDGPHGRAVGGDSRWNSRGGAAADERERRAAVARPARRAQRHPVGTPHGSAVG